MDPFIACFLAWVIPRFTCGVTPAEVNISCIYVSTSIGGGGGSNSWPHDRALCCKPFGHSGLAFRHQVILVPLHFRILFWVNTWFLIHLTSGSCSRWTRDSRSTSLPEPVLCEHVFSKLFSFPKQFPMFYASWGKPRKRAMSRLLDVGSFLESNNTNNCQTHVISL